MRQDAERDSAPSLGVGCRIGVSAQNSVEDEINCLQKVMSERHFTLSLSAAEPRGKPLERTNAQCISGPDSVIARDWRFGTNGIDKREREMGDRFVG